MSSFVKLHIILQIYNKGITAHQHSNHSLKSKTRDCEIIKNSGYSEMVFFLFEIAYFLSNHSNITDFVTIYSQYSEFLISIS